MENNTYLVSSLSYSRQSAVRMTSGVVGNPVLAAGLLLGYLLLGLIALVMAFCSQRSKLGVFDKIIVFTFTCKNFSPRGLQNVFNTVLSLFVMNSVNAAAAIILAVNFISFTCGTFNCTITMIVWFLAKSFGVILHLQSALVSVLYLCHPQWEAQQRYITYMVFLLIIVLIPVYIFYTSVAIIGFGVIIFGLGLAIIAKFSASTVPPSAASNKRWIVFVAMFTLLVVYLPNFVLQCLMISSAYSAELDYYTMIYTNILYGTNIQLFLDALLCLLILKLPAEVEEQQQHQQHSLTIQHHYANENVFK